MTILSWGHSYPGGLRAGHSFWNAASAVQSEKEGSPAVTCCPWQSRAAQDAVPMQCWPVLSLTARTPRSFSAELLSRQEASAQSVLVHRAVELCTSLCSALWGSILLTPAACPSLVAKLPGASLLWYSQQTCWDCSPSHNLQTPQRLNRISPSTLRGTPNSDQPPSGLCAAHHNPLSSSVIFKSTFLPLWALILKSCWKIQAKRICLHLYWEKELSWHWQQWKENDHVQLIPVRSTSSLHLNSLPSGQFNLIRMSD